MNNDTFFLDKAYQCAQKAYEQDEVPVGAVLVNSSGDVIAQAWNRVEQEHNQCEHAELQVLQNAAKKRGGWRLDDCTVYVTLEPCLMCLGAMYLFRVKRIVYGATSPLYGAVLENIENNALFGVYKNIEIDIVYEAHEQSIVLLKDFFKEKRSKKGEQVGVEQN